MPQAALRLALHLALLVVLVWMVQEAVAGADLVTELRDASGRWSLYLLLLSLCFTPVTRLRPAWRVYIPLRRVTGLWAFAFACVHVLVWISLEFAFDWRGMWQEIVGNLFIWLGIISFALLKVLAASSNRKAQRWRGYQYWRFIHTLIYPALGMALGHYFMAQKLPEWQPMLLISVFIVLLVWRWRYAD